MISDSALRLQIESTLAQRIPSSLTPAPAEDVARARREGASDVEIHGMVLIAASFWMYNCYVDGLDSWQPRDARLYAQMDQCIAEHDYLKSSQGQCASSIGRSRRQCRLLRPGENAQSLAQCIS